MDQLLSLFPLHTVLFPGGTLPLHIFEERYKTMIGRCLAHKEPFGVVLIREGREVGGPAEAHEVGTTAIIVNALRFDDGQMFIAAEGRTRFRIRRLLQREPFLLAQVEMIEESATLDQQEKAAGLRELYERYRLAIAQATGAAQPLGDLPDDPVAMSFQISGLLQVPYSSKQQLLEAELETRIEALTVALADELRYLPPPTGTPAPIDRRWSLN